MNVASSALESAWVCRFHEADLPRSVIAAFAAVVAEDPEASAVESGATEVAADPLAYRNLDEAATALAHALVAAGVRAGDVVGVQTARSPDLVVAILGVLKAGAAYLPLDAGLPAERLAFMVADAGARLAVVSPGGAAPVPGLATVEVGAAGPAVALPEPGPEDAAYVIYTSGSTGRPKGVVTPHRAVLRLVCGTNYTRFSRGTRFSRWRRWPSTRPPSRSGARF
jgi:non-ribosomal peptide synthetase component F